MKVQAIQLQDAAGTTAASNVTETTSDFSSYLNTSNTLDEIFTEASETYGVPKDLLKAIAKAESDFNPNATSHCGAQGVMQLMPATAKSLGVTDAYDPYQNIMGGAKYISQMLDKYNGNISLALAAYNAGPGNVAKYGGVPPFQETQNYVVKVTGYMQNGVSVPNASYSAAKAPSAAVETVVHEDSYYESILDQLFSYEDYLQFLEIYMKIQDAQNAQAEEEQQEQEKSDSYYSYQEIKYSPAVLNLVNSGKFV